LRRFSSLCGTFMVEGASLFALRAKKEAPEMASTMLPQAETRSITTTA
jgi:hypothetical protein